MSSAAQTSAPSTKQPFSIAFWKNGCRVCGHKASSHLEVHLSAARLVLLVSLLTVPALPQQSNMQAPGRSWSLAPAIRPEPPRQSDLRAVRLETIHQHAQELSALSSSVQSDLQQLQKGMLSKNLAENLKKMEKLSKKLRQEMGQ